MTKLVSELKRDGIPSFIDLRIENLVRQRIVLDRNFAVLFIDYSTTDCPDNLCDWPGMNFSSHDFLLQISDTQSIGVLQRDEQISIEQKVQSIVDEYQECNVGVAISPMHGQTVRNLIYNAIQASAAAKQKGSGTWAYHNERGFYYNGMSFNQSLYRKVRCGLEREEFYLEYQAQVHSKTGAIVGVEALLRWWPEGKDKPIPPGQFIPFVENTDLIFDITKWVLNRACRQGAEWFKEGYVSPIAVNVSPLCLNDDRWLSEVEKCLLGTGLPAELLEMEVTESCKIEDLERSNAVLKSLQEMGIKITLDDFGKEYSFLKYLSVLNINKIKIDRLFIASIETCDRMLKIVQSIILMARRMNIECLAEGVETKDQAKLLEREKCYLMQGFFWHKPARDYPVWAKL